MSEHVTVDAAGDVAVVRIDRPPANAFDLALVQQLHVALERLAAEEPGAVVLTGRERFFSSGFDLQALLELDADQERELLSAANRMYAQLYAFARPVICAVTGHAIAGGLLAALCADYRVGAEKGKLGLTEVKAGVPYPAATVPIVRAELPAGVVRRLVLRAELVDPATALELGLLDEVVAVDAVQPRALEVAKEAAAMPRSTFARVKGQLRAVAVEEARAVVAGQSDPLLAGWLDEEGRAAAAALL